MCVGNFVWKVAGSSKMCAARVSNCTLRLFRVKQCICTWRRVAEEEEKEEVTFGALWWCGFEVLRFPTWTIPPSLTSRTFAPSRIPTCLAERVFILSMDVGERQFGDVLQRTKTTTTPINLRQPMMVLNNCFWSRRRVKCCCKIRLYMYIYICVTWSSREWVSMFV